MPVVQVEIERFEAALVAGSFDTDDPGGSAGRVEADGSVFPMNSYGFVRGWSIYACVFYRLL